MFCVSPALGDAAPSWEKPGLGDGAPSWDKTLGEWFRPSLAPEPPVPPLVEDDSWTRPQHPKRRRNGHAKADEHWMRPPAPVAAPGEHWCNPSLRRRSSAEDPSAEDPSTEDPEWMRPAPPEASAPKLAVNLDLSLLILASRDAAAAKNSFAQNGKDSERIARSLISPCSRKTCTGNPCAICDSTLSAKEVGQFCDIFWDLSTEDQATLLSTCASTGEHTDRRYVRWYLMGHRICSRRLAEVLGTTKRTLYKRIRGDVDGRMCCGREPSASLSVNNFFPHLADCRRDAARRGRYA